MPSLYETYQSRKTGGTPSGSIVGGSLYDSYQKRKTSLADFVPSQQPTPSSVSQPIQITPDQKKIDLSKIVKGTGKFLARTVVGFADLITESLDFTANFIANNPIFAGPGVALTEKVAKKKFGEEKVNKWKDAFTGLAEKPKIAIDKIQDTEFIRPSEGWAKAPLKEKLTKRLGETLVILGPNIIPSFFLYAVNPVLGVTATIGSTANDVRTGAIQNGVPEEKAELLGLGTGILVGALDRLVPNELFSPAQKSKFISSFVKRIVPLALKEAGTEIVQEDIQIAAEATFREDLGWDEIKTRNTLAGLGGLLGGAGATTVVGTINSSFKQDILAEGVTEPTEKAPEVVPAEKPPLESIVEAPEAKKPIVEAPKPTKRAVEPSLPTEIKGIGEVKPKTISVPREQLPVGEGKKQISRLEARVKESLKNIPQEKIDELGLPTYKQMNKEENIFKATEYVFNNPEEALKVISGEIEAPKGILRNSIYLAMEKYSKGDVDLARRLASLESTRLGQEISILTELDPYSPVKIMRDIIKVRAKATERKYAGRDIKEVTKKQVQKGEAMIKPPSKFEWTDIIKTIRC